CAAAAEAPLVDAELDLWFGPGAGHLCTVLADRGLLRRRRDGWYWTDTSRAVDLVDLRGASGGPVRVIEEGTGRLLGTVDPATAPSAVHEGALYVHQGSAFEVVTLDLEARVASATATVTDLSTHARSTADVAFESVRSTTRWGLVDVSCGEVLVTRQVTSYLVRRWPSGQVLAEHPLDLPAMTLQTVAMWWSIPDEVLRAAEVDEADVPGQCMPSSTPRSGSCPCWPPVTDGTSVASPQHVTRRPDRPSSSCTTAIPAVRDSPSGDTTGPSSG
ncbi:MAG TPA: hypothetical protein VLQ92_08815, partial [Candidatus Limnocylindrales bacterium]|nr:hypothetical protein [Candidatus Limnocylindrales bacterium]